MGLDLRDWTIPKIQPCKFARMLEDQPEELKNDLSEAVAQVGRYTAADIARNLRNRNLFVSDRVIQRHRRGECSCG